MTTDDETDHFAASDVRAWRRGNWYLVSLDGKLIYKRYSRDRAFTHVVVIFRGNRSPDYPKQLRYLDRVELVGDWRWKTHWTRNHIVAPIEERSHS